MWDDLGLGFSFGKALLQETSNEWTFLSLEGLPVLFCCSVVLITVSISPESLSASWLLGLWLSFSSSLLMDKFKSARPRPTKIK
jgi:hypothetical protein